MSLTAKRKRAASPQPTGKRLRTTIDSFFTPQVPLPKKSTDTANEPLHVGVLNIEQTKVLRMVLEGENVFFTGAAGEGFLHSADPF